MNDDVVMSLSRANMYGFLATVFSEPPSRALLESLSAGPLRTLLEEYGGMPDYGEIAQDSAPLSDELAVAFTRLLVGPGQGYVPPYASIYLDRPSGRQGRPLLWGPATVRVVQIYRQAGVAPPPGQVPDHIGVELEFMRHLCACEAEARAQNDEEEAERCCRWQAAFLHQHLLAWAPSWASDVEASASHPFYRMMAWLLRAFLATEAETVRTTPPQAQKGNRSDPCVL